MARMMAGDPVAASLLAGAGGATFAAGFLASLTLFAALAILTIAFAVAGTDRAWAQDDDDAPADSAAADSAAADSLQEGEEGDEEEEEVRIRRPNEGFHPSYDVRIGVYDDVRQWDHILNADYAISDQIRLNNRWGLNAKDEQTLDHTIETRTSANSIEYLFSEQKAVGVRYSTRWNLDNNRAIENKSTNTDIGGFTRLEHRYGDAVTVSANLSAGTRNNDYPSYTEEGTQLDAELGVQTKWTRALRSDVAWNGSRSASNTISTTNPDSLSQEPQEAKNLDRASTFRGELSFNPGEALSMRVAGVGGRGQVQYPHGEFPDVTETRTEDRTNFDFAGKYKASDKLSFGFDASNSNVEKDYDAGSNATDSLLAGTRRRTNRLTRAELRAAVNYQGWKGGKSSIVLGRDQSYDQWPHQPNQEKSVEHGVVTVNHEQRISKKFVTGISGKIDLISYLNFRNGVPDSVPLYDRDLLASSIEWKGDYIVSDRFSTRFLVGAKDDHTVNISSEQAAENNSKQSLWARPSIQVKPIRPLSLRQEYEVRLDYTFFDDETRVNFLSRKTQLDTRATYQVSPHVSFDIAHFYQIRDEGSYDDGFDKNTQRSKQILDLSTGYAPMQGVRVSCGQKIEVSRAYQYDPETGEKVLRPGAANDSERLELFLEGSVSREVTKRLRVEVRARQTISDGTGVTDNRRSNIDASMRYAL